VIREMLHLISEFLGLNRGAWCCHQLRRQRLCHPLRLRPDPGGNRSAASTAWATASPARAAERRDGDRAGHRRRPALSRARGRARPLPNETGELHRTALMDDGEVLGLLACTASVVAHAPWPTTCASSNHRHAGHAGPETKRPRGEQTARLEHENRELKWGAGNAARRKQATLGIVANRPRCGMRCARSSRSRRPSDGAAAGRMPARQGAVRARPAPVESRRDQPSSR